VILIECKNYPILFDRHTLKHLGHNATLRKGKNIYCLILLSRFFYQLQFIEFRSALRIYYQRGIDKGKDVETGPGVDDHEL